MKHDLNGEKLMKYIGNVGDDLIVESETARLKSVTFKRYRAQVLSMAAIFVLGAVIVGFYFLHPNLITDPARLTQRMDADDASIFPTAPAPAAAMPPPTVAAGEAPAVDDTPTAEAAPEAFLMPDIDETHEFFDFRMGAPEPWTTDEGNLHMWGVPDLYGAQLYDWEIYTWGVPHLRGGWRYELDMNEIVFPFMEGDMVVRRDDAAALFVSSPSPIPMYADREGVTLSAPVFRQLEVDNDTLRIFVGEYPIVSPQEAIAHLTTGRRALSSFTFTPAVEDIVFYEFMHLTDRQQLFMPFYRFFTKIPPDEGWGEEYLAIFLVPAVLEDYLRAP
ncbi:MAG: hypothetical protein FWC16_03555 [Defluviitaleaceae bacterium]|nr:hypothetical protein [Defluviitaleaceae bacterium]MCL2273979.1 hypothetical protein [Defluviitaleaceae bacterium]